MRSAIKMLNFPNLLILPNKVYSLTIEVSDSMRASERFLIDHAVNGVNFIDPYDKWTTSLGVSGEFLEDYAFYKLGVPLEWLLVRFLRHHVLADTLDLLSGDAGQVLASSNYREYLGHEFSETETEEILQTLLKSWARVHPTGALEFRDLYVSIDCTPEILRRSLNALGSQGHLRELGQSVYVVKEGILKSPLQSSAISMDTQTK